jgi:hypothetical protein
VAQHVNDREGRPSNVLADLFSNRPGWRLEPSSSPGGVPVWCFVAGGKVELSVTASVDSIHLYEMPTDRDITFGDTQELQEWLRTHRAEAMQEPVAPSSWRSRFRKLNNWS